MAKVKQVENMENVFSISELFDEINFEKDYSSIIPFAKSNSDLLLVGGLDDKLAKPRRQVSFLLIEKAERSYVLPKIYTSNQYYL